MPLPDRMPPPYKSFDRSQMPADAVRLVDGGRAVWYRKGTVDLMTALVELPPHPADRLRSNELFNQAVAETAQYADTTLSVVAARLQRRRLRGEIKYRPRLQQLHEMCEAAAPAAGEFDAELAAIFTRRA